MTLRILTFVGIVLLIPACGGGGSGAPISSPLTPADANWSLPATDPTNVTVLLSGEEISSELISASFVQGTAQATIDSVLNGTGGTVAGQIPEIGIHYVKFAPPKTGLEISSIVNALRLNPSVATASADFIYTGTAVFPPSTDIEQPGLLTVQEKWGFEQIRMPQGWDVIRTQGWDLKDIIVGVIDTGFDFGHPDLAGNLLTQHNGVASWDFGENDGDVSPDFTACSLSGGHGTNVAGIISAEIDGQGINGVAPTSKMFPIKFWPSNWAILYCPELKSTGAFVTSSVMWAVKADVDVLNLSLGTYVDPVEFTQTPMYLTIQQALQNDIVVVAAAGNDGRSADNHFPSAMSGVISVGATDDVDARSIWSPSKESNFSDNPDALWIAAPGTQIYSTDPTAGSNYQFNDGTSFAAPFVSGLAALMLQIDDTLTPTQIASILRSTADDITVSYPGDPLPHTWKRINAERVVLELITDGETIERVSIANDGTQANAACSSPAISADGRYVVFQSDASTLVPNDTNNATDIFVYDRLIASSLRVSVAGDGSQANDASRWPSISANGRYVTFSSDASNLVPGDTNTFADIFIYDRLSTNIQRASIASDGTEGNRSSGGTSSISVDGRFIAFSSIATNLVLGDINNEGDIFVHDQQTGQTSRVSIATDGTEANFASSAPFISSDGRYVCFASAASNLVAGTTNIASDIFVHDLQTGQTNRVSVASDGTEGNGNSSDGTLSTDGRFVTFVSDASNLVPGDTNGVDDAFVHDVQTGQTLRVSIASDGTQQNASSIFGFGVRPAISSDGDLVVFPSPATNLVPNDTNGFEDIFVHDLQTGQTNRVSVASDGTQGDWPSRNPSVTPDGAYVTFTSVARNLVPFDTNNQWDIFVVKLR